jgi:cobalamin biosynthesis protein CobD/CbiB
MVKIGPKDGTPLTSRQNHINKALWLIGTARNAIIVVISMFIGYLAVNSDAFKLTGEYHVNAVTLTATLLIRIHYYKTK